MLEVWALPKPPSDILYEDVRIDMDLARPKLSGHEGPIVVRTFFGAVRIFFQKTINFCVTEL